MSDRLRLSGILLALLLGGCEGPRPSAAWRVYAAHRLPAAGSEGSATPARTTPERVELAGAMNETLSFAFHIRCGAQPMTQPALEVEPLTSLRGRIEPSAVRLFRMHSVNLGRLPGWHLRSVPPAERVAAPLDVLVPLPAPRGGMPGVVEPGEGLWFWADVHIPKGVGEGTYSTEIRLRAGGRALGAIPLHVTVWPFVLPDEGGTPLLAGLDHQGLFRHHLRREGRPFAPVVDDWRLDPQREAIDGLLHDTLRMLREHRLTPLLPELTPPVRVGAGGEVQVDWGGYDEIVGPILDGGLFASRVGVAHWPLPLTSRWMAGLYSGAAGVGAVAPSPVSRRMVREYAQACATHFQQRGWLERAFLLTPWDGGGPKENLGRAHMLFDLFEGVVPRVPLGARAAAHDLRPYGWFDYPFVDLTGIMDIWSPAGQFFDPVLMGELRSQGRRTWMRVDRPPFSGSAALPAVPAAQRVLSWQAAALGAEALEIGMVNHWPPAESNPDPSACAAFNAGTLLYPGGGFGLDRPVASVRLKHLRRSAQDDAYRRLLREHRLGHVVDSLTRAVATYAGTEAYRTHFADGRRPGWLENANLYELAREIMGEEIRATLAGDGSGRRRDAFTQSATWRRFMLGSQRVEVSPEGCRVRLVREGRAQKTQVACGASVFNRSRLPWDGALSFVGELPGGLRLDGAAGMGGLPPYSGQRTTLVFEDAGTGESPIGPWMAPSAFGCASWTIAAAMDSAGAEAAEMRACAVSATRFRGSLRVDGSLDDWPPGIGNVLGDFRLISGGGGGSPEVDRPRSRTLAFVLRDESYLYVGINAETAAGDVLPLSRTNLVRYDDMVPVREELVEILLDPLNAGTRSPSDLYYIAVKPSGAYLARRGVAFDPPCGRSEPWAVDLAVATRLGSGRWIAEVRIPLAAFDGAPGAHVFWGLNVTRFDLVHDEFSTWSGAVGNAYDPMSLGNVYLPVP